MRMCALRVDSRGKINKSDHAMWLHSDEGLTLEMSVLRSLICRIDLVLDNLF